MKSDIQLYPDLIKALEKNEIVYLFGAGFSTALSGRKYTWWDWIVDGIGRIKDHATADMLNESLMSDNSTDNMVSVVGKVIKILKEEGSYKTWMHEAFESTVVVNEKLKNTLMKILLIHYTSKSYRLSTMEGEQRKLLQWEGFLNKKIRKY